MAGRCAADTDDEHPVTQRARFGHGALDRVDLAIGDEEQIDRRGTFASAGARLGIAGKGQRGVQCLLHLGPTQIRLQACRPALPGQPGRGARAPQGARAILDSAAET